MTLHYYNQRAHYRHRNRGLPPLALYGLWRQAKGANAGRLTKLGILRPDDEWTLRSMAAGSRTVTSVLTSVIAITNNGSTRIPHDNLKGVLGCEPFR